MVELTSLFVMIIGGACVLFSLAQINDSLNRIAISLGALDKNEAAVGVWCAPRLTGQVAGCAKH